MNTRAQLVAAVRRDPLERSVRRAFVDWLMEFEGLSLVAACRAAYRAGSERRKARTMAEAAAYLRPDTALCRLLRSIILSWLPGPTYSAGVIYITTGYRSPYEGTGVVPMVASPHQHPALLVGARWVLMMVRRLEQPAALNGRRRPAGRRR